MNGILEVLSVAGLFLLRIGVPILVLLVIGTLVERAYNRREAQDTERPIAIDMPQRVETDAEVEEDVEISAYH